MTPLWVQILGLLIALVIGGGLTIGVARIGIINLQDQAIRARDTIIQDLRDALATVKAEHQAQLTQLAGEIAELREAMTKNAIERVAKDSAIALAMKRALALEATLKHYDQLRASCPNSATCPLERRHPRKPRIALGGTP